jgi:hypothetical protein
MTTTSPAGLAAGRWTADPACSTATFTVSSLGRTVTGTVPITEARPGPCRPSREIGERPP